MEDDQLGLGSVAAQSNFTEETKGQALTDMVGVKNQVQESYDVGDGDEIMVEIVGTDVFIDGDDGIKGTDLAIEEFEDLDGNKLLSNGEEAGAPYNTSQAEDVISEGDRNELDESKGMPFSSVKETVIVNTLSELPVKEDSIVNNEEKLVRDDIMVAPEITDHPTEGKVTGEEEEIKENIANNSANGVQDAVSEGSPKLDTEGPNNVVEENSLAEASAEDVRDEKSAVSIGEKVVDAESDDLRDLKKSDDGLKTDMVHEHHEYPDQPSQLLEVTKDKEQVDSGEPPITTSMSEVTNDQRDIIYSEDVMVMDMFNEKVEAVDSEVLLESFDDKGTDKADDNVNLPTEDGSSGVETAEDIVEANVLSNDPMVIDDTGLHDNIKDDGFPQINKEGDFVVQVTEPSTVSVQVTENDNVGSTDLIPDDFLKTASGKIEKEQLDNPASNISLSAGVHTEEPLVTDVASCDDSNKNNGHHVAEGPTSESEAMNVDHQAEEKPTSEIDNVKLSNLKSTTQTLKPSFKIGECIRRVASQLTGSTSSANEKVNDGSLNEQSERESVAVSAENSSVDDMLLQLAQVGCDPNMKTGKGLPNPTRMFFSAFRSSVYLNKRGRKRKALSSTGGSAEEFEFDDVNDSYWTDRIVQNYPEEQLMQNNENDNNLQLVPVDLEKYAKRGPKPHSRKRYSTGSYPSETTEEEAAKRRKQETSPAELILNFAERNCVPSEINLNKIFRRFGPIMESETEVDVDSGRARVIFKRGSDAEVAHSSAEKFNIFGPILVNYQIGYTPVIPVKVLPIVVAQSQEDQALMA